MHDVLFKKRAVSHGWHVASHVTLCPSKVMCSTQVTGNVSISFWRGTRKMLKLPDATRNNGYIYFESAGRQFVTVRLPMFSRTFAFTLLAFFHFSLLSAVVFSTLLSLFFIQTSRNGFLGFSRCSKQSGDDAWRLGRVTLVFPCTFIKSNAANTSLHRSDMLSYEYGDGSPESFIFQWPLAGTNTSTMRNLERSPLSPNKRVRFADLFGQSLVSVKIISPANSTENLAGAKGRSSISKDEQTRRKEERLRCCFPQPAAHPDSLERRLKEQNVCLENVVLSPSVIVGTVIVRNIAFAKEVSVRYTVTEWQSYRDIWADYVPFSSSQDTDKFQFRINLPPDFPRSLEFAVRYRVAEKEFWDNNDQLNYRIESQENRGSTPK